MGIWANCFTSLCALAIGHMAPLPNSDYGGLPRREVSITFKDPVAVHLLCGGELNKNYQIFACAGVNRNWIIMPDPCRHTEESYARLLCHELGHTKGWPANHPNAIHYNESNTLSAGLDIRQTSQQIRQ